MCINIIKRINIQRNVLRPFHPTLNVVSQCEKLWTTRGVKKKQQRTGSPFDSITRTAEALYAICLFYNWKICRRNANYPMRLFNICCSHENFVFCLQFQLKIKSRETMQVFKKRAYATSWNDKYWINSFTYCALVHHRLSTILSPDLWKKIDIPLCAYLWKSLMNHPIHKTHQFSW